MAPFRRLSDRSALQHVARQVFPLGNHLEAIIHIGGVDQHLLVAGLAGLEGEFLEELLHHRVQAPGADVLGLLVHLEGDLGKAPDALGRELEAHAVGGQQGFILASETGIGLREDALEVLDRQGIQLDPDREAPLQFAPDGIRRLAEIAFQVNEKTENIGARRLYTVMEKLLEELAFEAGKAGAQTVAIDAAYVDGRLDMLAQREDLARYVL